MRTKEEILKGMSRFRFDLLCYTDFKFFCERMLGLIEMGGIHDFQLKWIDLIEKHRLTIIEAPSGSSKSEIVGACYPLWKFYQNPKKKIENLIVSKTRDQSEKNLLIRQQNYILDNEILRETFVPVDRRVSWTKTGFRTINGSVSNIVPYNLNIKGSRAHIMPLDEIDSYEDPDIFFKHVLSRTHAGGKIIGISTPEGISNIIGQLKEKNNAKKIKGLVFHRTTVFVHSDGSNVTSDEIQTEEDFARLKKDGCVSIWPENEKFTFEYMKEEFLMMGRLAWIQNYLCEVLGFSEDAAFPLKCIIDSYDDSLTYNYEVNPQAMYFIGADFATSSGPRADYDGTVVIELLNNTYTLKYLYAKKGVHPEVKVRELRRLYDIFSKGLSCRVIADETNAGSVLIKMIRSAGMTTIPQNFTGVARFDLLQTLANVLKSGYLVIPKNPMQEDYNKLVNTLQTQLSGFHRTKTEKGNETFLSKAPHDDMAIALALAVKYASKQMTTYLKPISV